MVCEQLPSPLQMSNERVEKLLASQAQPFDTLPPATQLLKNGEPNNVLIVSRSVEDIYLSTAWLFNKMLCAAYDRLL